MTNKEILFNLDDYEFAINPLTRDIDKIYIYDYEIKIVSNSELTDGTIIFNIGE